MDRKPWSDPEVNKRAKELLPQTDIDFMYAKKYAELIHYPRCWDTMAYPTLADAIWETLSWAGCSVCKKD